MKVIEKHEFWPTVCVCYTILSLGKIALEFFTQGAFGNEQANYILIFVLCFLATLVLSQHYRLDCFPLPAVIIGQYILLIAVVFAITWIIGQVEPLGEHAYRDMFRSFTIPYIIGAMVYYAAYFFQVKKANRMLENLKKNQKEV
ncbi:MAG: hypothetical protein IJ420_02865 [Lachnospiraceae bacterium]|nr:hypothetical protein [Lachnospiraceae bacterium]